MDGQSALIDFADQNQHAGSFPGGEAKKGTSRAA
jgi:hypothetical protein